MRDFTRRPFSTLPIQVSPNSHTVRFGPSSTLAAPSAPVQPVVRVNSAVKSGRGFADSTSIGGAGGWASINEANRRYMDSALASGRVYPGG